MRCKNCGWPNKPNETVCTKCGSPLENESQPFDFDNGYSPAQPHLSSDGDGLKKTVMESNVFDGNVTPNPRLNETLSEEEATCPKCGYPMRTDAAKCPNCNYSVRGSEHDTRSLNSTQRGGYQRRPTRMSTPDEETEQRDVVSPAPTRKVQGGGGKFRGTINPYMMSFNQEPVFVLKPIQRMNERKPVESVELEGSEVVLTRDNTEPGNPTITSEAQAVVTHRDGHWYIENSSAQKTTFVLANNPIELKSGDIILLGNRMFEFQEQ